MTLPKLPPIKRIKERYNPKPTARERAFHIWCYEGRKCVCCDAPATVFHHLMMRTPSKRWHRRDHEIGVPMNGMCHMLLHQTGSEEAYKDIDWRGLAEGFRKRAYKEGVL